MSPFTHRSVGLFCTLLCKSVVIITQCLLFSDVKLSHNQDSEFEPLSSLSEVWDQISSLNIRIIPSSSSLSPTWHTMTHKVVINNLRSAAMACVNGASAVLFHLYWVWWASFYNGAGYRLLTSQESLKIHSLTFSVLMVCWCLVFWEMLVGGKKSG